MEGWDDSPWHRMMTEIVVLAAAGSVLIVTVLSGRLERFWLTEPIVAVVIGVLLGRFALGEVDLLQPAFLTFLELTLALTLFADASRIDIGRLRGEYSWPARMLALGLPLAIALGTAAAAWFLGLPLGFALVLGVVLAPTDAALAEPVLEMKSVPSRIRQTINVEAGLNDGLAVPALLIATGFLEMEEGMATGGESVLLIVQQLGVGIVGGVLVGLAGAWIIGRGAEKGWMDPLHQKIAALSLALAGFAIVQILGGSGFVAVFIAGALMSHRIDMRPTYLYDFAEAEGHIMVTIAFLVIGAGPVTRFVTGGVAWEAIVMALIALLVVRPAAIALSLVGEKLSWESFAYLGWFGPRGLATVVFFLLVVEEVPFVPDLLTDTGVAAVTLSIFLHGLSAVPLSKWCNRRWADMTEDMPEMMETPELPTRRG